MEAKILKFKSYTEEDLLNQNKFKVYLNYLKSISNLLDHSYFTETRYLEEIIFSKTFKDIKSKNTDIGKITKLLRNSWLTEIQLNFTKDHPEFMAYSNHWACVQLYYSVYLSLRALSVAMNKQEPGAHHHAATLREISQDIYNRPNLFPYPWRVICAGDPNKPNFIYLPQNVLISPISPLVSNPKFWDSYSTFLKTTRKRQLESKRKDWLNKNKRKNLSKEARKEITTKMPPTTFFDCLYRLRTRANYQDAELFLMAIEIEEWAKTFNYSLRNIANHTLLIIELLIMRYMGKQNFVKIVSDFLKYEKHSNRAVAERWKLLNTLY